MKDPRKSTNWDSLSTQDRTLWMHAYFMYLGKGRAR